jgi:hypothetical protein
MKKCFAFVQALALALAGCATPSKDISPTSVSPMQYSNYDCDQIAAEQRRIYGRVGELGGRLDQAASNDNTLAWSALLLWPTLFWLGGTKQQEAEYARLRGEYDALHQAAIMKKCAAAMAPTQQAAPTAAPTPAVAPAASTAPALTPTSTPVPVAK